MSLRVLNGFYTSTLLFFFLTLTGCSSSKQVVAPQPSTSTVTTPDIQTQSQLSFVNVYEEWKGTPYRLGGTTKRGIDCSAFVQVGYSDVYQTLLPRTTGELAKMGKSVSKQQAKYGDLVFFKTGYRLRHVGIYIGNNQFMHASTSKGVIVSRLDNPYWQRAFWQIRRMPIH
ncbi:NlpC/P60 family protein [Photobacterium swingsii]|uniref:NlpC/P60 family protein n=1 Tax=Photobacterium swingsii TaxID=680026 RepID=UPI0035577F22